MNNCNVCAVGTRCSCRKSAALQSWCDRMMKRIEHLEYPEALILNPEETMQLIEGCKDAIEYLFKRPRVPFPIATLTVTTVDRLLECVTPLDVIRAICERTDDGLSLLQVVERFLDVIGKCSYPIEARELLIWKIRHNPIPVVIHEATIGTSVCNIITFLDEFEELLNRTCGSFDRLLGRTPCFFRSYSVLRITPENEFKVFKYKYMHFKELELSDLSAETQQACANHLNLNDPRSIEFSSRALHSLVAKLRNVDYTKPNLTEGHFKLSFQIIIGYLNSLQTYLRHGRYTNKSERINYDIRAIADALWGLPLVAIFRPEYENWILQYVNDLNYVIHNFKIGLKNHYTLWDELEHVRYEALKLRNICLKRFRPSSLRSKVYREQLSVIDPEDGVHKTRDKLFHVYLDLESDEVSIKTIDAECELETPTNDCNL